MLRTAGAVAASVPVAAVAGKATAAESTAITGVAEVLDADNGDLVVRLRQGGRRLQVPAEGFDGIPVSKGDLVAVMPKQPGGDATRLDSVSAQPFLRVHDDLSVWKFESSGEPRLVGQHS